MPIQRFPLPVTLAGPTSSGIPDIATDRLRTFGQIRISDTTPCFLIRELTRQTPETPFYGGIFAPSLGIPPATPPRTMKKTILAPLSVLLALTACGKPDAPSQTQSALLSSPLPVSLPATRPADGSYVALGVGCFDSNGNPVSSYSIASGSAVETIVIGGASITWSDATPSCTATTHATLVYGTQTALSGSGGYGNVTVNTTGVTVTGATPCIQTLSFVKTNPAYPNLSQSSFTISNQTNSTPSSKSYSILYDPTMMSLYTILDVPTVAGSSCFLIYQKQ